jgi:hypothetical protein
MILELDKMTLQDIIDYGMKLSKLSNGGDDQKNVE